MAVSPSREHEVVGDAIDPDDLEQPSGGEYSEVAIYGPEILAVVA
ncbi:MAG: hypothetical protein R3B09_15275 [Nannocystaceae bacterium]